MDTGLIPEGQVDERDIREVRADELNGSGRAHFFAGIAGWELALQLAGWPEDRPVWTGSCPCQPFSNAGRGGGVEDERHLWPVWGELISERKPPTIFGEQVASRLGRLWLSGVRADLEAMGYAVGAADLCAAGIGSPQIRQRLWWVGRLVDTESKRPLRESNKIQQKNGGQGASQGGKLNRSGCFSGGVAHARHDAGCAERGDEPEAPLSRDFHNNTMGDTDRQRPQGRGLQSGEGACRCYPWAASSFVNCLDGKTRRIEPRTFPLAHGVPGRVGKLRAYGNAIVPQVAAEFIRACMEIL